MNSSDRSPKRLVNKKVQVLNSKTLIVNQNHLSAKKFKFKNETKLKPMGKFRTNSQLDVSLFNKLDLVLDDEDEHESIKKKKKTRNQKPHGEVYSNSMA